MIFIIINDIHKRIIVFIVIVAMVINNKMARRCSLGSRTVGFYMDFEEIPSTSLSALPSHFVKIQAINKNLHTGICCCIVSQN